MNLIVGGTGFIGGHLAEYFLEQGEISKGIFRKGSHLRILDQCGVQNYEADLLDRSTLHEPLEGVQTIYNLASPVPNDGEDVDYLTVNTKGMDNLLHEAKEHGVATFAHLSTLDVYGFSGSGKISQGSSPEPTHPYQRAKLESERILLEFARSNPMMRVRIIRAARAIGPRDRTLTLPILKMAQRARVVVPSGSDNRLSLSHPKDIAQALYRAATVNSTDSVHLIKSFDATVLEVAETIVSSRGMKASIRQQGMFSGKTNLSSYVVEQINRGLFLERQASWESIGYSPGYDLRRVGAEVADWYRKESWITTES